MTDDTDALRPEDEGLPSPEPEGPGLFGDAEPTPSAPPPAVSAAAPSVQEPAGSAMPDGQSASPYRVLARKYRPTTFDDLIGQEAMVRTLRNAFALGRVAHAFMLTGVRGVGKTTTARIIARALNCTGPDGNGGPTADPCGVCPNCVAILADRHPDVLEMDAASRTGVDDVREIIEATRFRPMQGRMKVFIIDEVHMLSRNAFNALLKTLEEPPAQVTFIFATTELRKVPVTVLSRCQRFDLRRVPQADLVGLFARIADKEHVRLSDDALALIARAADGSVRDGLSLLDQAIAQGSSQENAEGMIEASVVTDMLGLADREVVFDLLEAALTGQPEQALALMDAAHARGADAGLVLGDMLELVHTLSRLRAVPSAAQAADMPEAERVRGTQMAGSFPVPVLMRAWQMLLKGMQELETAPDRRAAADMVLIRLCFVADLPSPEDLVRRLSTGQGGGASGSALAGPASPTASLMASPTASPAGQGRNVAAAAQGHNGPAATSPQHGEAAQAPWGQPGGGRAHLRMVAGSAALSLAPASLAPDGQATPAPVIHAPPAQPLRPVEPGLQPPDHAEGQGASPLHEPPGKSSGTASGNSSGDPAGVQSGTPSGEPVASPAADAPPPMPRTWREAVALVKDQREAILHGQLRHAAHLVSFAPGRIVLRLAPGVPADVPRQLRQVLERATGMAWQVNVSEAQGEPTLDAQGAEVIQFRRKEAASHPLVRAILAAFPDAELGEVRDHDLDDYGLPPEEIPQALSAGFAGVPEAAFDDAFGTDFGPDYGPDFGADMPDFAFAPLDAALLDADERPYDPGQSPN
ncbi:DNA polymerase III subunit gamma/tau [Acetobacter sp. TBRC 12305]|uniref:DNA-directed DNA polymerase n=1 Tax=Acetobacter garciniae TaxID=2817435 RepID=A0A939HHK9_9PROT|nr:DNA polymerase III subunit gamma/tau [Acetobacter garciniae]MBO1324545.1 DNA polymerase III subunit gamma/tau [Acetobacter garciniae]MBX0344234.1 DNA polymerase III subunit gamma/tau [Acetobacter garciniae]